MRTCIAIMLTVGLLTTSALAQREMPTFDNNRDRGLFLLEAASRIAPAADDKFSWSMQMIAEAYGKLGAVDEARRALMSVDKEVRPEVQCLVAKHLAEAGEPQAAQALLDEVGEDDVITDMQVFGKINRSQVARDAIAEAMGKQPTLEEAYAAYEEAKTPAEKQKVLYPLIDALLREKNPKMDALAAQAFEQVPARGDVNARLSRGGYENKILDRLIENQDFEAAYAMAMRSPDKVGAVKVGQSRAMQRVLKGQAAAGQLDALKAKMDELKTIDENLYGWAKRILLREYAKRGMMTECNQLFKTIPEDDTSRRQVYLQQVLSGSLEGDHFRQCKSFMDWYADAETRKKQAPAMSRYLAKQGEFERATVWANGIDPELHNLAWFYLDLADMAIEQDKPDEARKLIALAEAERDAIDEAKEQAGIWRRLAWTYAELGEFEAVMQALSNGGDNASNIRTTVSILGNIYVPQDDYMKFFPLLQQVKAPADQVHVLTRVAERINQEEK